jgi:hypothetical protein
MGSIWAQRPHRPRPALRAIGAAGNWDVVAGACQIGTFVCDLAATPGPRPSGGLAAKPIGGPD